MAVHDGGRHVLGVIPRTLMPREITGETVGEVRVVSDMHQRKAEMAQQADAFIALPVVETGEAGEHHLGPQDADIAVDEDISFNPVLKDAPKEEPAKGSVPSKGTTSSVKGGSSSAIGASSSSKAGTTSTAGLVTEEEIMAVLLQKAPITSDLVANFKARLKSPEDKKAFANILRRFSKIQK